MLFGFLKLIISRHLEPMALALVFVGTVSMLGLYLTDHFNILVGYEEWLRRGMPERPF